MTTTITINSGEVPHLDEQPGLKCCVLTCTVNLDDHWYYRKAERDDRCRVCSRYMAQWPDLIWFFSAEHDPTFDAGLSVNLKAMTALRAACHSFLARTRWHEAKLKQLQPSCRHASAGTQRKPCSGNSSTQRGTQRQPRSCRHGSADEGHSFCCDVYVLTRHNLQWRRPESRRFSVAEPHEPGCFKLERIAVTRRHAAARRMQCCYFTAKVWRGACQAQHKACSSRFEFNKPATLAEWPAVKLCDPCMHMLQRSVALIGTAGFVAQLGNSLLEFRACDIDVLLH